MRLQFAQMAHAAFGFVLVAGLLLAGCGDDPSSPENRAPRITSLSADPGMVDPAGISTITCTVSDPDQDNLTYTWDVSDGELSGSGATGTWIGPTEAGPCTVSVTVEDGSGGSDSDTTTVEVRGGTLLVETDTEVLAVDMSGNHFSFVGGRRQIEVAGSRIFFGPGGVTEMSHSGIVIDQMPMPAEAPSRSTSFVALPEGGFVFMENWGDTLTFATATGAFVENVVMPDASSINQSMYGVVVGDRLVISETGGQKLVQVDLSTREAGIFKDLSHLGKWLGDIDYGNGSYYMVKYEDVYRVPETGIEEVIFNVPDGFMLGLAVVGKYAYCTDRKAGRIYRVDVLTGEGEVFVEGLAEPRDIEFLPVALPAP